MIVVTCVRWEHGGAEGGDSVVVGDGSWPSAVAVVTPGRGGVAAFVLFLNQQFLAMATAEAASSLVLFLLLEIECCPTFR
jgi:hypothetical protein